MDCRRTRIYIGAFADGELDVQRNLEVLEHLNMCPECAARVDNVHKMKSALARASSNTRAPGALRVRINAALEAEEALLRGSADARAASVVQATGKRAAGVADAAATARRAVTARFWARAWAPLSMAAALAIVAVGYQLRFVPEPVEGTITVITGRAVSDVRKQHDDCITRHGMAHHDASLSRALPVIAQRLGERLDLEVIVPDLSVLGFVLVGADRCGIQGRAGAHVLYRATDGGAWISVFTVGEIEGLAKHGLDRDSLRDYFVSGDDALPVVSWRSGDATYVVCGDLPEAQLRSIVSSIQTAAVPPVGPARLVLASARGR